MTGVDIDFQAAVIVAERLGVPPDDSRIRKTYTYAWVRFGLALRQLGREIIKPISERFNR